jgi:hypothetical protein
MLAIGQVAQIETRTGFCMGREMNVESCGEPPNTVWINSIFNVALICT